jgi:tetratricopeptide (TPR) repeat protein
LNALGAVLFQRGQVEAAKENWKRAIAIDSRFAPAYYNMGMVLEKEKDLIGARMSYAKAVKYDPSMDDAQRRLAKLSGNDLPADLTAAETAGTPVALAPITLGSDATAAPGESRVQPVSLATEPVSFAIQSAGSAAEFDDGSLRLTSSAGDFGQSGYSASRTVELSPSSYVTPQDDDTSDFAAAPKRIASREDNMSMFIRMPQ